MKLISFDCIVGFMDMMIPIIEPLMYKYKVNMAFYGAFIVV